MVRAHIVLPCACSAHSYIKSNLPPAGWPCINCHPLPWILHHPDNGSPVVGEHAQEAGDRSCPAWRFGRQRRAYRDPAENIVQRFWPLHLGLAGLLAVSVDQEWPSTHEAVHTPSPTFTSGRFHLEAMVKGPGPRSAGITASCNGRCWFLSTTFLFRRPHHWGQGDLAPMPLQSTSLSDFWALRWNVTTSHLLRAIIYDPIVEGTWDVTQLLRSFLCSHSQLLCG